MQTLRAKPALMILFVLLALTLLSGVAYAVGRSLGYIPGVGMVEQGSAIRILAEPVSLTRDGITLSVTEAVLTSDKTVVMFTLENVPWDALSHNENVGGCPGRVDLRLPDGTTLELTGGEGSMSQTRFIYPPIPSDVNEATFVMPCISQTLPGLAPENWELPLRFEPSPPDMTIVPVVEIVPTSAPQAADEFAPVQITQALQVGDDYVVVGTVAERDDASGVWIELRDLRVADANGKEIYTQTPTVDGLSTFDWGFQFKAGAVQFPLTLAFDWMRIAPLEGSQAEFEFDAGDNPQPGQTWQVNQALEIGGRTLQLTRIQLDSHNGYSFEFECDPDVTGVSAELEGYSANGGGGGGGYGLGQFSFSLTYAELPTGKLKLRLSNLTVADPLQTWRTQFSPENIPPAESLYGVSFALDKYIPTEGGYYLIGHTTWTDSRIKNISPLLIKASDASGQELALDDPARYSADTPLVETLEPNQWAYRLYGTAFDGSVTLHISQVSVEFQEPVRLTLDLRPYNFTFSDEKLGAAYKTGIIPLDVPGLMAKAFKATYFKEGSLYGFEIGMEADPALQGLTFNIESGLDNMAGYYSDSFRDPANNLLISRVASDAPMSFPLVFAAQTAVINGAWQTTWTPPAAPAGATPFYAPQACVTLEKWKQADGEIPAKLPQRILLSRGAISPDPSLFLVNLDGGDEQALVFGNGTLSPNGQKLIYSDENNRLVLFEINNGQKKTLGDGIWPHWSPDGRQIAFMRTTPNGDKLFVMDASGQNLQQLTDVTTAPEMIGWTPDSRQVMFGFFTSDSYILQTVDVASGSVDSLPIAPTSARSVAVSPDGEWLAYLDRVPGKWALGLYLARLDGSEKQLLVQLDTWAVFAPNFSPDGKWLAVSAWADLPNRPIFLGLVNLETCQVVALPLTGDVIVEWVK